MCQVGAPILQPGPSAKKWNNEADGPATQAIGKSQPTLTPGYGHFGKAEDDTVILSVASSRAAATAFPARTGLSGFAMSLPDE